MPDAAACRRMMVFSLREQRNLMIAERETVLLFCLVFIVFEIEIRVENGVIAHRYPPTDRERGKMQFVDTN